MNKNTSIAISWVLTRTFMMACIMLIARVLGMGGMNVYAVMFWQSVFSFIIMAVYCVYKKELPRTSQYGMHILRCVLGLCSGTLLYYALPMLPLNTATSITFTGPLFSTIAAMIFLRERTNIHRCIGLLVGFCGVLIILRPGTESFNPNALFLILTAMIWGLTDVTIKKLLKADPIKTLLFYMSVIMLVLCIPFGIFHWHVLTLKEAILCMALAMFNLGNFLTISNAFKRADISVLMPFEFFRLVFSSIFAYLIFNEMLDAAIVSGSLVIVGSSLYVARKESKITP